MGWDGECEFYMCMRARKIVTRCTRDGGKGGGLAIPRRCEKKQKNG